MNCKDHPEAGVRKASGVASCLQCGKSLGKVPQTEFEKHLETERKKEKDVKHEKEKEKDPHHEPKDPRKEGN